MWPQVFATIVAVMGTAQDWSGVEFGRTQFEQVQQYAEERMLDPPVPGTPREQFAWRHATEFALWNRTPLLDLVPASYVAPLNLQASTEPLVCDKQPVDGLLLVHEPVWNRDPPALKLAWQAWHANHVFGKRELYCVLRWLDEQSTHANDRQTRGYAAWINAASGWLKGLDKHSDVLAAAYWDRVCEPDQTAPQADLGFAVTACTHDPEQCCVADVREGGSAWLADLRVGDRLQTAGFDPCETPALLKGDAGTKQELRLFSILKHKLRTVRLTRDFAVAHDVSQELLAPGYLHLRLSDFVKGTAGRVRAALAKHGKQAWKGIVLDMRDNTGGVLDESIAIADLLLSSGTILKARWHNKPDQQPVASDTLDDVRVPVVAIVNRMCASACEVLTGALQDHHRALIVGEHTLGKASMQRVAKPTLMAGFYIKATIGHYLTPNDRDLDGVGTLPDLALPLLATTQFAMTDPAWQKGAACVAVQGTAPKRLAADVAPRKKPDPWLAMAGDWARCLGR
jgi:C-terminal peptidase prc